MSTLTLSDIIDSINVDETVNILHSAIKNTNNTAFDKASNFKNAKNFMHNEAFPYKEILHKMDSGINEYEKKELLFFSYYLTKGLTWSSLAREKQRYIDLISVGLNKELLP